MNQDFTKFIAFAESHPKLLGRNGLFGAYNEDHTAFTLFAEYLKKEKHLYHQIPKTIGLAGFKAYILSQDANKYQDIIERVDNLHQRGYLHDQLGSRDLYDLALIFDELRLDQLDPRFASNTYNQFLLDSYGFKSQETNLSGTHDASFANLPLTGTEKINPNLAEPKQNKADSRVESPISAAPVYFGTASLGLASSTNVSAQTSTSAIAKGRLQQNLKAAELSQPTADTAIPNAPIEQNPQRADEKRPLESDDFRGTDEFLSTIGNLPSTLEMSAELQGDISLKGEIVAQSRPSYRPAPAQRMFQRTAPVASTNSGTSMHFLDTVTGLRQKVANRPTFVGSQSQPQAEQNQEQNSEYSNQAQQTANNRRQRASARGDQRAPSPGKKLLSRVFKSVAGLGGALALIPNANASAQVIKKAITVALFSLIVVANVSFTFDTTAHAANPAPAAPAAPEAAAPAAAGVPSAACPQAPVAWVQENPTTCSFKPAADDLKCPAGFDNEVSRTEENGAKKLVCSAPSAVDSESTKALENMTGVIVGIQKFLNTLIWPILVMIGGLMDNSLLFGSGMEERLRDIWIPMRNLVNILFVVVLVGVALYNVLGIGGDDSSYSIKSILPKIVVGIIAVNFSFLGIKVVLDATNIITTSIFALPADASIGLNKVLDPNEGGDKVLRQKLCANIQNKSLTELTSTSPDRLNAEFTANAYREVATQYWPDKISKTTTQAQIEQLLNEEEAKGNNAIVNRERFNQEIKDRESKRMCNGDQLTDAGIEYLSEWSSRNAAMAMAINMGGIVFYNDVKLDTNTIDKLFINTLFSTIMYIVYVASFVALFIILLGRLLVMWICVAMSPLLVLVMFSSELKEKVGGFAKLEEQFTKNAIAPIIIAISMTVGWIMLNALKGLNTISSTGSVSLYSIMPNNGVPVAGLDTLGDFIVALGTIGVVWLGVFSAADGTVAQGAVEGIFNGIKSAGKFIGSIPLKHVNMVPIKLPGQAESNYSLRDVGDTIQRLAQGDGRNKLLDALKPDNVDEKTFNDTSKVKKPEDFYRTLSTVGPQKLKEKSYRDELEKFQAGELHKTLPDEVKKRIKAVIDNNGSDTSIKALYDYEVNGQKIRDYGKLEAKPTPPTAPGTPPAGSTPPGTPAQSAPAVANMADDTVKRLVVGDKGSTLETQLEGKDARTNIDAFKASASAVATKVAAIPQPENATEDQKKDISAAIATLNIGDDQYPTNEAQLKAVMGAENAQKVMKVFGGNEGYGKMIDQIKADNERKRQEEREKAGRPPDTGEEE